MRGRYAHRKRSALLHFRLAAMSHELEGGGVSLGVPRRALEPPDGAEELSGGSYSFGFGGELIRSNAPDAVRMSKAATISTASAADAPTTTGAAGARPSPRASPRSTASSLMTGRPSPRRAGGAAAGGGGGGGGGTLAPAPLVISSPRTLTSPRLHAPEGATVMTAATTASFADPSADPLGEGTERTRSSLRAGGTANSWRKLRATRTARRVAGEQVPLHSWRVLGPEPEPPTHPLPAALTPRAQTLAARLEQLATIS